MARNEDAGGAVLCLWACQYNGPRESAGNRLRRSRPRPPVVLDYSCPSACHQKMED